MNRRERNKDDKHRRILAAARDLMKKQGFEATTMRALAEAADVGLGTVYSYVRDKHHLLDLISRDDVEAVAATVFASLPRDADLLTQLMHVFRGIFAHHGKDLATARTIFKELGFGGDPDALERAQRMMGLVAGIAGIYEAAQASGRLGTHFQAMEAATYAFALHYFLLVVWMSGTAGLDEATALTQLERALSLQITGLGRQHGEAS